MTPVNKITSTKRGKAAIAAALAASIAAGYTTYKAASPSNIPPAVELAATKLILPWEGLVLTSHWDVFSKRYDICHGETLINGKPVTAGMSFTKQQCDDIFIKRVIADYYQPLTKCVPGYLQAPISVQASMLSGAYNFGVSAQCNSTATRMVAANRYRDACIAQTAFNKAGGQVINGLVKRREMGDAQRLGEAETCVSGL
ncbi:MAG: glycoside hydrolase [Rhizobium sp.]|nr:MAG: glycoside hydrolase [Rhizobium sp.]